MTGGHLGCMSDVQDPERVTARLWAEAVMTAARIRPAAAQLEQITAQSAGVLAAAAHAMDQAQEMIGVGVKDGVLLPDPWRRTQPLLHRALTALNTVDGLAAPARVLAGRIARHLAQITPRIDEKSPFTTRKPLYAWLHHQARIQTGDSRYRDMPAADQQAASAQAAGEMAERMAYLRESDYHDMSLYNSPAGGHGPEPEPRSDQQIEATVLLHRLPGHLSLTHPRYTVVDLYVLARVLTDPNAVPHAQLLVPDVRAEHATLDTLAHTDATTREHAEIITGRLAPRCHDLHDRHTARPAGLQVAQLAHLTDLIPHVARTNPPDPDAAQAARRALRPTPSPPRPPAPPQVRDAHLIDPF